MAMAPILPVNNDIWEEVSDDEVSSGDVEPPIILNNDSDASSNSDDEFPLHTGYELLPQEPDPDENPQIQDSSDVEDGDEPPANTQDGDSERVTSSSVHSFFTQTLSMPPPPESMPPENVFAPEERKDVNQMDTEHIEKIKSAMAGFTLPSSAVPDWAVLIPEEEWKMQLVSRLQHKKGVSLNSPQGTASAKENTSKSENSHQQSDASASFQNSSVSWTSSSDMTMESEIDNQTNLQTCQHHY